MDTTRDLIAAFHELNETRDRSVAQFTPSLVGMFGSKKMLDLFLDDLAAAIASGSAPEPLRKRAANLVQTFIPQVAAYNGITDLAGHTVTPAELRAIANDSPDGRLAGVRNILAAFIMILRNVIQLG